MFCSDRFRGLKMNLGSMTTIGLLIVLTGFVSYLVLLFVIHSFTYRTWIDCHGNPSKIQAGGFVIFSRVFAGRTFRRRLGPFVDITANAAFPLDRLLPFEDVPSLDHFT